MDQDDTITPIDDTPDRPKKPIQETDTDATTRRGWPLIKPIASAALTVGVAWFTASYTTVCQQRNSGMVPTAPPPIKATWSRPVLYRAGSRDSRVVMVRGGGLHGLHLRVLAGAGRAHGPRPAAPCSASSRRWPSSSEELLIRTVRETALPS